MNSIIMRWRTVFEEENNKYNNYFFAFIIFFLMGSMIYFAKIVTDLPNPDAVWNGVFFKDNCGWEISLGRYGIGFLQVFRTYVVNTTFITLVCMLLLSFICIYVLKIFDIRTLGWKVLAGALIIISPTVGSTLTYYYCSDFYMLSYLLAVLAVWLMLREGKTSLFAASICLMVSAAIYQAYISLAILLCFIYLMKMTVDPEVNNKQIIEKAIRFLSGGFAGVVLYLISNKVVQKICMIDAQQDRGFAQMGAIDLKNIFGQIAQCYSNFWQYYFGSSMINNLCCFRRESNVLFFFLLGVILLSILLGKQGVGAARKLVFMVMCLLYPLVSMNICILAPKVSIFGSTGVLMLPTMNYLYILAIVLTRQLNVKDFGRMLYEMGALIGTAAVFVMLLWLELGGQTYMKYNMLKTYNVSRKIEERVDLFGEDVGKVCIVGNMESGNYPENYPKLAESQHWVTAGHKMIWQDYNGCQSCWHEFMKQYLGKTYDMCSKNQYDDMITTPEYSTMGIFPEENGAVLINDIVVIKLSDPIEGW